MSTTETIDFYATMAQIIVTLYVALAVEMRLFHLRERSDREPLSRKSAMVVLVLFVGPLVFSVIGLLACIEALASGGSVLHHALAKASAVLLAILFVAGSLDALSSRLTRALFAPRTRQRLSLALGALLSLGGVLWLFFGPR
ncbi:MAG TPA: hypothetical protein VFX41_04735 [Actinomycetales bacterium]|nr:hypothetical protein [Actinomycetales bacterium]